MIKGVRKSLTIKWMVFSILLATLPLSLAGFSIIRIFQKDLKKSVIEMEEMKASMVIQKTEVFFKKVTTNLLAQAKNEDSKIGRYSSHVRNLLENLLSQNDSISELSLRDERGKERIKISKHKVIGLDDLKNQSEEEKFGVASKGDTYYGEFYHTEEFIPAIGGAVPIKEKPVGVLSEEIGLRYLWNLLPQIQIGKNRLIYMVGKEGNLIDHPDTKQVLTGLNVRHLLMVDQVVSGREGYLQYAYSEGQKTLGVYKPIRKLNGGVIAQIPTEEAYAPLRQIVRAALGWVLVAMAIAIILSLFLTRKFIFPLKRLSQEMGKVPRGGLNAYLPVTTKDGGDLQTKSFNQMIEEFKQPEEGLKETEQKYERIFENLKDMVYVTSSDGKFIDVNQAGIEMLGYENREELFKMTARDTYLNPEEREKFLDEMNQKGFVKDFETKLKKKGGTPIDVLITANARKDEGNQIIGYEGIIKDISDRKRIEEELVQSKAELQGLYDMSVLINQTLDLERILPIALEKALSFAGFEKGTVHFISKDGENLELKSDQGFSPAFIEKVKVMKYGEGVAGKAITSRKPVIFPVSEYPSPRILPFLENEEVQLTVGIPLLAKGNAIGAITLSSRSTRTLTQREIHLLESIGYQIGLALENAQLFSNVAKAKSEWETTFDAVTDLITIRYKDYRIIRANKAAFKRFGLKPNQMVGKKCYEILHHRHQPCEGCYIAQTLTTKNPGSGERESKYLKGIFHYYTFPIYDIEGEVVAVVDLAREITEKKRLEMEKEIINNINKILASGLDIGQVFKAVHSELNKVFESEKMTITLLDERDGYQYFELEKEGDVEELFKGVVYPNLGSPIEKALHMGLPVIVPDTAQNDSWVDQKLMNQGIRSSMVYPLIYKERIIGTLNLGSKELDHFQEKDFDLLQQIAPGLAISIKNSLLLDSIKASEEKYRTVVEGALDGVGVVAKDNRIRYANKRLAEIQGLTQEKVIGMNFTDFLEEESKQLMADCSLRREKGEKLSPRFELNIIRGDGEVRNVEVNARVIKDSKEDINYIVFIKDITEKRKMEEQLFQAEKLRALAEMASGVAHDFNNALASILGNAQLLLFTVQDEEAKESLRVIEKVAKDSAQTVRRLQDFTRKKVHQELIKVDINLIIKDSIEITKPKWKDEVQNRGIRIEVISNLEDVPMVSGNASELREVITNLIFNAIEAMPQGGKIEVHTFKKGKEVFIQISDTGIGIAEEVRKKVFEPFFTTKPFTNTGLGLSMSYGIVKRFGGEIEVKSKVGHGTTFTIILPRGGDGREEMISSSTMKVGRKARILVIDDEEFVRSVLARTLAQVNHQVTLAENGEKGLQLFKDGKFDIVLTDLGMAGMSGWEVCKMIKKISPHTPVGMITGWRMEANRSKMEEYGLDFFISKPFDFNQILNVVAETMESGKERFLS
jgi:PAS domain S-box-containing protein